jgi:AbrB family looped-hinge helix DNA binding protein
MNAHSKFDHEAFVNMTSKGQVLIPKAARDAVGLKPNRPCKVAVNEQNQIVITPLGYGPDDAEERVRRMRDGLEKLAGLSQDGRGTDAIMRELRGDWEP